MPQPTRPGTVADAMAEVTERPYEETIDETVTITLGNVLDATLARISELERVVERLLASHNALVAFINQGMERAAAADPASRLVVGTGPVPRTRG